MSSTGKDYRKASPDSQVAGPATKKLRFQPPDVVVSVGSGDSMQEFECYKVILSFTSPYFDTMLSSNMKERRRSRIEFPDKDPEEWKLLDKFITPPCKGKIDKGNVLTMLSWFHEFQMSNHVEECDKYLAERYFEDMYPDTNDSLFWNKELMDYVSMIDDPDRLEKRKDKFSMIIQVLQLAKLYDLPCTMAALSKYIANLMAMSTEDLFDSSTVEFLLGLAQRGNDHLSFLFEEIQFPHISNLTQDILNDKDKFKHLFFLMVQDRIKLANSAKSLVETMIRDIPQKVYDELPDKQIRGMPRGIDTTARRCIMRAHREIYSKKQAEFKTLGIPKPPAPTW